MPETVHTKTRRIAKNTVLLFIRSLFNLFLALYTSRLVLQALGVDDYGVYNVVGGFVSMFSIVSSSLSGAISRFLNYAMGKGNKDELANIFSMSLNIMAILSIIVLLLTETFGLWYINNRMNIPDGREVAALWCFHFSILSSISSFLVVPFTGAIISHEKMGAFAYIDIGETFLKFIIALFLTLSLGDLDKLVTYAALLLCVTLSKQMISRVYAMKNFEECKLRWYWSKKTFFDLFSYSGWSFLGKASGTFAGQGVNMIINVVFGPAVNAARQLSGTVNHSVQIFVNNFTVAINPQITQSYASGEWGYMKDLLFRGTKFTYYIMWIIFLPLVLETEFVVKLWLGNYPNYTITFIRLALVFNLINILYVVLTMGIRATGNVKTYFISFSLLEFLLFFSLFFLLHHGYSPEWSYYCAIIMACIKVVVAWYLSWKQLHISIREYIRQAIVPILAVSAVSSIIPLLVFTSTAPGWLRFFFVLLSSLSISALCILFIGCTKSEREMLISMILNKLLKKR